MGQRAEQLHRSAVDCEQRDDPDAARAARQEADRWMHKAGAAKCQLQEVDKILEQKKSSLTICEREAAGLLRGEERQGGKRLLIWPHSIYSMSIPPKKKPLQSVHGS
jgi:hypothetical protein